MPDNIPQPLADILAKPLPPKPPMPERDYEQISKLNPFSEEAVPPIDPAPGTPEAEAIKDLPPLEMEDEPPLGAQFGVKPIQAPTPMPAPQPTPPPPLPSPAEAPMSQADPPTQTPEKPAEEAKEVPIEVMNDPEKEALLEQLEEERRRNESLRKQMQDMAEKGGNIITRDMWGMKHRLEESEASLQKAREALDNLGKQLQEEQGKPKMQPMPEWTGKDVVVLFPCMKTTNPVTALMMLALALDFGKDKIGFEMECGDSMIYHSRNVLADRFLERGATWSLWLDDDIIPPVGRPALTRQYTGIAPSEMSDELLSRHVLTRLMSHNQKLIGGTYFGRRPRSTAMFHGALHKPNEYQAAKRAEDRILPTDWVATGCLSAHRDVYLAIRAKYPELAPTKERPYWDYFLPTSEGGEDVMFCKRAKTCGFQPYVDLGLQCLHVGYACYGRHNTVNVLADGTPLLQR